MIQYSTYIVILSDTDEISRFLHIIVNVVLRHTYQSLIQYIVHVLCITTYRYITIRMSTFGRSIQPWKSNKRWSTTLLFYFSFFFHSSLLYLHCWQMKWMIIKWHLTIHKIRKVQKRNVIDSDAIRWHTISLFNSLDTLISHPISYVFSPLLAPCWPWWTSRKAKIASSICKE